MSQPSSGSCLLQYGGVLDGEAFCLVRASPVMPYALLWYTECHSMAIKASMAEVSGRPSSPPGHDHNDTRMDLPGVRRLSSIYLTASVCSHCSLPIAHHTHGFGQTRAATRSDTGCHRPLPAFCCPQNMVPEALVYLEMPLGLAWAPCIYYLLIGSVFAC